MRIFGIPLSVDVSFFMIIGILGLDRSSEPILLVQWIALAFVAIVVHELGHALVGQAFGLTPRIRLYGMGGLTSWSAAQDVGPARRIAISLAGPFAGFAFGALVLAGLSLVPSPHPHWYEQVRLDILFVTFGWGVLNLVPMLPLDGGQVMRSFLELVTGRSADVPAQAFSVALALLIGGWALATGNVWIALLTIWFGWSSASALIESIRRRGDAKHAAPLDAAWALVGQGRGAEAVASFESIARSSTSAATRNRAGEGLVYAYLQARDGVGAGRAYAELSARCGRQPYLEGAVALANGDPDRAASTLEQVFNAKPSAVVGRELCRAYVRSGRPDKALALCSHPVVDAFAGDLYTVVAEEAFTAGLFDVSAEAGAAAAERSHDPMVAYNVACALVRSSRLEDAIRWLRTAVDYGFSDAELAASDDDLAELHAVPEFHKVVEEMKANSLERPTP